MYFISEIKTITITITRRKTSRGRERNQQTQSTSEAGSGIQTQDTLAEGEYFHHVLRHPCKRIS